MPADGAALVLAVGDVEGAVDQHREAQAGAGAELEKPDAPLDAVAERHQPDAGDLGERSHMGREVAPGDGTSVEARHGAGESFERVGAPTIRRGKPRPPKPVMCSSLWFRWSGIVAEPVERLGQTIEAIPPRFQRARRAPSAISHGCVAGRRWSSGSALSGMPN